MRTTAEGRVPPNHVFFEGTRALLFHFWTRLKETPLLIGWLIIGLLVTVVLDGWFGLVFALINLVITGVYVLLIRKMTPFAPLSMPLKRPRLELVIGLALVGVFLIVQLFDFGVWNLQPWQGWVRGFFTQVQLWVTGISSIPKWAKQDSFLAVSSTIKKLIPTLLVFVFFGYGRQAMGLTRPHWKITAVLVGITAFFGVVTGYLTSIPLNQILVLYFVGILINALPEELFFRGLLLPRLEKALSNPLNALVVSALLFNLLHIPIEISNGASPLAAMLSVFSISYPSGLIWGYLYLRTRSILPGMFWHAANGMLGFMLMSR